eukprot:6465243-Alexandrium_andersonii.AAC.1
MRPQLTLFHWRVAEERDTQEISRGCGGRNPPGHDRQQTRRAAQKVSDRTQFAEVWAVHGRA